jgi:RNA polymerase sigma factor (sigma-70 family)
VAGSGVTALSSLQRRMDAYPQLSPEAQSELALRYRSAVARSQDQSVSDRDRRVAAGEAERCLEYLTGANFRLVQLIAREKAQERFGAAKALELLPDLVAEGMVALTEAARTYDPGSAPTFTKYAQSAVRNHIRAAIANSGPMRVTSSVARMKRIATKRLETLTEELGRPPTRDELQEQLLAWCLTWAEGRLTAREAGLDDEARLEAMMAKLRKQGMLAAIANIDEVLAYSQSLASLSSPVGDGSATLGDLMPSSAAEELFDQAELGELNRLLLEAIDQRCTEREREILLLRFGLAGSESWTYSRIAPRFDLTAERIRQIERVALVKLAEDPRLAAFLPELDGDG